MTGADLRELVAEIITGWVGGGRGGPQHQEIMTLYNSVLPHPRGWAAQVSDDYCAETVCAAAVKAGIARFVPFECSCGEIIKLASAMGIWEERDDYIPKVGDWIIYAWNDPTPAADNRTGHNHIGVVTKIAGYNMGTQSYRFTVTEGNVSGRIATREMYVNAPKIRGYVKIPYEDIALRLSGSQAADKPQESPAPEARPEEKEEAMPEGRIHKLSDAPPWAQPELKKLIERGALKGGADGDLDLSEDMLRVLLVCQRMVDGA